VDGSIGADGGGEGPGKSGDGGGLESGLFHDEGVELRFLGGEGIDLGVAGPVRAVVVFEDLGADVVGDFDDARPGTDLSPLGASDPGGDQDFEVGEDEKDVSDGEVGVVAEFGGSPGVGMPGVGPGCSDGFGDEIGVVDIGEDELGAGSDGEGGPGEQGRVKGEQ